MIRQREGSIGDVLSEYSLWKWKEGVDQWKDRKRLTFVLEKTTLLFSFKLLWKEMRDKNTWKQEN